jgi:hypothetical protein
VGAVLVIAALAALAVFAWYQRPVARAERRLRRLEARYFRSMHMPPHLAREALQRHTARLRERHPGHSPAWYVEQVLADLQRDRR